MACGGKDRSCNHCLFSDHSHEECVLRPQQVAQYYTRVEERRGLGKATGGIRGMVHASHGTMEAAAVPIVASSMCALDVLEDINGWPTRVIHWRERETVCRSDHPRGD